MFYLNHVLKIQICRVLIYGDLHLFFSYNCQKDKKRLRFRYWHYFLSYSMTMVFVYVVIFCSEFNSIL